MITLIINNLQSAQFGGQVKPNSLIINYPIISVTNKNHIGRHIEGKRNVWNLQPKLVFFL